MSQITKRTKITNLKILSNYIEIVSTYSPEGTSYTITIPVETYEDIRRYYYISREVDLMWKTNINGKLDISFEVV